MTDDATRPTRRQLLQGAVGIGATGATAGIAAAHVSQQDSSSILIRSGAVSIHVDCSRCFDAGGPVGFTVGDLEPGDSGTETFDISIEENSSRLWFRTDCPPVVDPLGEAVQLRLLAERETSTEQLFPTTDDGFASLEAFNNAFTDGIRLDEQCLSPADELSLILEYELPSDATWSADLETEITFELFAKQCRNIPEADVKPPFESEPPSCPERRCLDCQKLGTVAVQANQLEPETYSFDELYGSFETDSHEYRLEVLTVTNKVDTGRDETVCASFRLLEDGAESASTPLCQVEIAGGPDPETEGPATKAEPLEPPTTRTHGELCTADGTAAISTVTVYACTEWTDEGEK